MSLRRLLSIIALLTLGGCFMRALPDQPPAKRKCHNSRFWDGEKCRN